MTISQDMKPRERNEKIVVLSPAHEDSGVATSGDIGELSFSGECEGVVCLRETRGPKGIEGDENQDPRSDFMDTLYAPLELAIRRKISFPSKFHFDSCKDKIHFLNFQPEFFPEESNIRNIFPSIRGEKGLITRQKFQNSRKDKFTIILPNIF